MLKTILVRRVSGKGLSLAFAGLLIASAATLSSPGQTAGTGTITGVVTDTSGAAIANATVVITNTDTSVARTIQTPRMYVPAPQVARSPTAPPLPVEEPATLVEPAPARIRELHQEGGAPAGPSEVPPPPPLVDPGSVKYER